ncbi:CLUMA_CG009815, isoform A [Clunio marinus]|uniref:CLUMA_CG009815, isoform A n=1 Tax=Clunio marinus TaxID=568069 RepID=A0A1J1IBN4_9DIPT|nr:CLUMA_CG009815, isoform A [Clunio marinus]
MDEECLLQLEEVEVKFEPLSSDEEYEFQFEVDDADYDDILKDLKHKDSDLEEVDDELKTHCPHEGCKKSFSRNHNLVKHLMSHEMGINRHGSICHICGKLIKGVYSIHLKIHENTKQFRCDDCGREFRQKIALRNHILIHKNEKPHECGWGYKKFRQKYTMLHHMKNRHTGVKDHICELCGKEFSDKATLMKHLLVHSTSKPHQCSTCFMSFRHKSSLSRHNKIHLKVTQCTLCHRSFRYESFLKKHLLTVHKGEELPIVMKCEEEKETINIITYDTDQTSQIIQLEPSSQYYSQPIQVTINKVEHTYSS